MKAIDLYSGVGGWSLGLSLAGFKIIGSFEKWAAANETNLKNNHHRPRSVDIRTMDLESLPRGAAVVVGSPPCTEFSFSNRGGSGNISGGLVDIIRFFEIIDYLRPKVWAMENVPRVAHVVQQELAPGGALRRFNHLDVRMAVVNAEDFGLPQRRRRCIVGNVDFDKLAAYPRVLSGRSLGDVVEALAQDSVVDPIFGITVPSEELLDHDIEDYLDPDEERINRARKEMHPVYNRMSFPDEMARAARTITATCTRVSRESIVIPDGKKPHRHRRLTIRERASLQGFPISFQFYGASHAQKMKMIGNAVPPPLAYYIGHAILGTAPESLPALSDCVHRFAPPSVTPPRTSPHVAGASFPRNRPFRFAIPSLRLKSGVRFELTNVGRGPERDWHVGFVFGSSKAIQRLRLDGELFERLRADMSASEWARVRPELRSLKTFLAEADLTSLQRKWSRSGPGEVEPFELLDRLDAAGSIISARLKQHDAGAAAVVARAVAFEYGEAVDRLVGLAKLARHSKLVLAGLLVGSLTNTELAPVAAARPPTRGLIDAGRT